jgi:hypothetical protein
MTGTHDLSGLRMKDASQIATVKRSDEGEEREVVGYVGSLQGIERLLENLAKEDPDIEVEVTKRDIFIDPDGEVFVRVTGIPLVTFNVNDLLSDEPRAVALNDMDADTIQYLFRNFVKKQRPKDKDETQKGTNPAEADEAPADEIIIDDEAEQAEDEPMTVEL